MWPVRPRKAFSNGCGECDTAFAVARIEIASSTHFGGRKAARSSPVSPSRVVLCRVRRHYLLPESAMVLGAMCGVC